MRLAEFAGSARPVALGGRAWRRFGSVLRLVLLEECFWECHTDGTCGEIESERYVPGEEYLFMFIPCDFWR